MEDIHREAIRANYVLLTNELPTREVLGYLTFAGLFSLRDMQEILELPPSKRNRDILSLLVRKGPRAMTCFTIALLMAERTDLLHKLFASEGSCPACE